MRVVFMGTPDFSVPVLDALIEAGHEIAAVYCQPPRPAGRGKKDRRAPVHQRADVLGLDVRHPLNFKDTETVDAFAALNADVAVVVAYGLILPQVVLDAPARGCLNIHASLLPRWRGAAPIHRAIMAGDVHTGVCIMQMEAGLDTGPVLLRAETAILATDTTAILHDRLAGIGAGMIVEALNRLDDLDAVAQSEDGVTYAKKIEKAEAQIDWSRSADEVDRHIRGLSPFPGAWFADGDQRVKVLMSHVVDGSGTAGEVIDQVTIACGSGAVALTRLQRAGKGPMDVDDFIRGYPLPTGKTL
tara:strand:+ start:17355 stop:18257 length:903 start_codon:yes stop_codon:yes gene_type:complete